jgi:RecA/RadA recombinase
MSNDKKLDLSKIADKIKRSFKNDKLAKKVGLGSDLKILKKEDFIQLGEWWTESTKTYGLPFGKITMIAGPSDSGKTSFAIQAMKAAQEQGITVIYTETEGKTTAKDLESWGVKSNEVLLIQARIAEEAFELTLRAWDAIKDSDEKARLLVIIDSLGNVVSQRDSGLDLTEDSQQPGGKGKINRLGLNKIVAKMEEDDAAILLISYTYDNLGSVGRTNAGGQALNFFSSLSYQTSRKGWVEKTEKGRKVRIGADVLFKLYKNHVNKEDMGEKEILFRITNEGISYVKAKEE